MSSFAPLSMFLTASLGSKQLPKVDMRMLFFFLAASEDLLTQVLHQERGGREGPNRHWSEQ